MPDVWWDDIYVDAANVNKTTLRNSLRDYGPIFSTAAAFTALDTKGQVCAIIDGGVYVYDATDSTTVHDGEAICVDATGRRYKASTNGTIRVDASVNITVPTQISTIQGALDLLRRYTCDADKTLTITLANGTHSPGANLNIVHPQGHAITIRSATAPSAMTLSATKSTMLTRIKAAYAAVIDLRGSDSINIYSYAKFENVAIICDTAGANTNTCIRTVGLNKSFELVSCALCNFNIGIVGGAGDAVTLQDVFVLHMAGNGVQTTAACEMSGTNLTSNYNGTSGVSFANGARMRLTGTLTVSNNASRGVLMTMGAVIDTANLVCSNNTADGIQMTQFCTLRTTSSTTMASNATGSGFALNAQRGCYVVLQALTFSGAGNNTYRALQTSSVHLTGGITGTIVRDPTTADTASATVATSAFSY